MIIRKLLKSDEQGVSRTQKTISLSLASTVNTVLNLLLSMAAARLLTKTEIAVNSQTLLAYNTVAPFLTLGITSGIYYYLSKNEQRKRAVANESMLVALMSSLLFCVFICTGGNHFLAETFKNPSIAKTLYLLIPYVLLVTPASIMTCILVYENRLRFNAIFSALQTFFTMIVVLAVMAWKHSGWSMVAARSLMGSLFAIITIYCAYSVLPKGATISHIQWKSIKALLAISIPLGLASMVGTVDKTLDQWIVSSMLTPEIYAVYVQGARELPLIGTITGAISTVLIVDLTKAVKNKDYSVAVELFRTVSDKSSMLLMPIMVFFMAAAKPFISFLYTDEFLAAVPIFQIYLLYLPIRVVQYSPFLIALGKSKFVLWKTAGGLVVNAVFSVIFVQLFGAQGAAFATVLALYIFNVPLNLYIISKETKISWKQLLPFRQMFRCIMMSLPGAVGIVVVNIFFADYLSAFWLLVSDFALYLLITGPLFILKFHLSPKKILATFLPGLTKIF